MRHAIPTRPEQSQAVIARRQLPESNRAEVRMSNYKAAHAEVLTGELFAGCLIDGDGVSLASITEDIVSVCDHMQRQLVRLAAMAKRSQEWEILEEAVPEFAVNAEIVRGLSAARVKLANALLKDEELHAEGRR